jgi:cbb3-type cytochrome oxidase subunit 1
MKNGSGVLWIKIASVYFVLGISLGIYMGVNENFTLRPVHAHLNLLGWVSLALFGLIYQQFPQIATTRLAKIQFWLHNVGLPFQMIFLIMLIMGNAAIGPFLGMADIAVGLAIVLFMVNVFSNLKQE